uniref:Uncharacterized protein n=1 Tax=Oryza nivara TaxID=4536 RepID=A0A0E0GXV3_ORYNI
MNRSSKFQSTFKSSSLTVCSGSAIRSAATAWSDRRLNGGETGDGRRQAASGDCRVLDRSYNIGQRSYLIMEIHSTVFISYKYSMSSDYIFLQTKPGKGLQELMKMKAALLMILVVAVSFNLCACNIPGNMEEEHGMYKDVRAGEDMRKLIDIDGRTAPIGHDYDHVCPRGIYPC